MAIKVGDKVRVLHHDELETSFVGLEGEVLRVDTDTALVKLPKKLSGRLDGAWIFTQPIDRFLEVIGPTPEARAEKPCQVCQRMNDIGVKSCYWCGNSP